MVSKGNTYVLTLSRFSFWVHQRTINGLHDLDTASFNKISVVFCVVLVLCFVLFLSFSND